MTFLDELASRRRFGMKPGLDSIRGLCASLGNPQERFRAIHVAGTNGKGAVCAMLDAALRTAGEGRGMRVGRYTSPHLVRLNERFFLDGAPVDDATLEHLSERVSQVLVSHPSSSIPEPTFFEALTVVAFLLYAEARVDYAILECGLGGRLDATNVCRPALCIITKIGLDHCAWLGDTVGKIAAEKTGIVKPGVPVVLGRNEPPVRDVVESRAKELGAPFYYAPDLADEREIPAGFPLEGSFNRENAVTAIAALKVLRHPSLAGFSHVVWPGRFQRVGDFIVDGAHNPPAARALAEALRDDCRRAGIRSDRRYSLIAGFCGDKDVGQVLSILAPLVGKGFAVRTNSARSLSADESAARMRAAGIEAVACDSLRSAIQQAARRSVCDALPATLVCGSLFLAGEALVELGAYPERTDRFDPSELL